MIDDPSGEFRKQLDEILKHGNGPKAARFALACLGGEFGTAHNIETERSWAVIDLPYRNTNLPTSTLHENSCRLQRQRNYSGETSL